jgi:TonB family protein
MKNRSLLIISIVCLLTVLVMAQDAPKSNHPVAITLKNGQSLYGNLVSPQVDSIDLNVDGAVRAVKLGELESIRFIPTGTQSTIQAGAKIEEAGKNGAGKPTVLYKEKAQYTKEAAQYRVQGVVVLNVIFTADGRITDIRVIHGLPDGLTEMAIDAARKIRFQPAKKDGQPIDVRAHCAAGQGRQIERVRIPPRRV